MVTIRPILPKDDATMASIIFASLESYGLDKPGTVYTDASTKKLSTLFTTLLSGYLVAEENGRILGGCGIFPTPDLPQGSAELVKMYVDAAYRGKGLGTKLVLAAESLALSLGYNRLYLESFPNLKEAISLYKKLGFNSIAEREGNSCHYECDVFMQKTIAV